MVKGFRGRGLVEGGKEPIFNVQPGTLLGKCHMMHAREVGKEKPPRPYPFKPREKAHTKI